MMVPMKVDLPYLYNEPDHRGNGRLYVRKGKHRRRIKSEPGTAAFAAEYAAAIEAIVGTVRPVRATEKSGTLGWLAAEYFASPAFRQLDSKSQNTRRGVLEACLAEPVAPGSKNIMRACPLELVGPDHIQMLMERCVGAPGAANNRKKYLSAMFGWAVPKYVKVNPCRDIKRVRYFTEGYYTWTLDDVRQFCRRHPENSKARLALALLLFSGLRRGDMVTLGRQHVRDGWIRMVLRKTRYRRSTQHQVPMLPILQAAIEAAPTGDLTFLVTQYGKPFTANGFGGWFRARCNEAGLPQCTAHGLRKAAATIAAENGATDRQMMALFGWSSVNQVTKYVEAANQKRMAGEAASLSDWAGLLSAPAEQVVDESLSHAPDGLSHRGPK